MAQSSSGYRGLPSGWGTAVVLLGLMAATQPSARGSFIRISFQEVAQTADLIFVGTVTGLDCTAEQTSKMIFTQVHFGDIQVIHATVRSVQAALGAIRLTHAGGKVGGRGVWVSVAPSFQNGHRYLVFMQDDGLVYANPVVGGPQGQFEIIQDRVTLQDYVLTADGRAVLEVGLEGLKVGPRKIDHILDGAPFYAAGETAQISQFLGQLPIAGGNDSVSTPEEGSGRGLDQPVAVSLSTFLEFTLNTALARPLEDRRLRSGPGTGRLLTRAGEGILEQDLSSLTGKIPASPATGIDSRGDARIQGTSIQEWYDSDLFACGYHDPIFTMEQVSTGRWDYDDNETAMAIWNFTIDFYRYVPDDGLFGGGNGESEFVGFIDDAAYYSAYGFHWGGASAMTISYIDPGDPCDEIQESDVMFNSAFSWTDDFLIYLAGSVEYYPAAVIHETGHVWGYMSGKLKAETYAYNHPSVMNNAGTNIIEDALAVHVPDVNLMRRIYDSLTGVPQVRDVGVEAYYASLGLHKSTTLSNSYYPGDSITIDHITVENLSPTAQTDVRLRFFLSADRSVTTSDSLMGAYFYWPTFAAETYSVANYTTTVPYISSGPYYVGAIATLNGFAADDAGENNATYLPDTVNIYPMPPSNVQATDGTYTDRIRVTWNGGSDPAVTAYGIWRSTSDTGTKTYLGQTSNNYYDDLSPVGGWNYYWVQSVAAIGTSLDSSYDSGYVGVTAPAGLAASDGTYTTHVALSWSAVTGASGYEIWRHSVNDSAGASQIGTSASASYSDATAVPELMYYYWVKATNGIATSGFSGYDAGWRALAAPTNVQASDGTFSDKVRVTWNLVAYAATYHVRRNTTNDFSTSTTVAASVSGTTCDDTTAVSLQTYYYWVRAENGFGYSQFAGPDTGYRSTPVPQASEIIGDFGGYGVWMLHNAAWTQLTPIGAESLLFADIEGDGLSEMFGDFGVFGLWLWNNDIWTCLTLANAEGMITGDIDGDGRAELIGDAGALGLWVWNGGDWAQLSGVNPVSLAAADVDGDGDQDVVGNFGSIGIWVYLNHAWTPISPLAADSLTSGDLDGDNREEIVGDFGSAGVWLYDHPTWSCLTDLNPEALLILDHDGDGIDELAVDMGWQFSKPEFSGLWLWDGGTLTNLNWNNAVKIIAADTDARPDMEIVGTYLDIFGGSLGFWTCDGIDWTQLNPLAPETFAAGDFDADGIEEVLGDFGALGLWFKDADNWYPLTGFNAVNVGAANLK